MLAWVEDTAVVVHSGPGSIQWERPVGGLVVAQFRHYDSRRRMPLLHDHRAVAVLYEQLTFGDLADDAQGERGGDTGGAPPYRLGHRPRR